MTVADHSKAQYLVSASCCYELRCMSAEDLEYPEEGAAVDPDADLPRKSPQLRQRSALRLALSGDDSTCIWFGH